MNRNQERQESVRVFRGLMYGTLFSLPFYAVLITGGYYLYTLVTR